LAYHIERLIAHVNKIIPAVYTDDMSYYELLNKVLEKLDEVISETNDYFDKDLSVYVGEIISEWYDNGKLATIINDEIFTGKADRVDLDTLTSRFDTFSRSVKNILMPPYSAAAGTDIGAALNQAVLDLISLGGGIVYIPPGDYIVDGSVELASNIAVMGDNGTILRKTAAATEGYLFTVGRTRGVPGYGGGGRNIRIENIEFHGYAPSKTDYRAIALSFNHAADLCIKNCRFFNCITQDHAIDLAGCNNVLIENCSFEGSYQIVGREYNEAIQIDSSTPAAMPGMTNYDGLPTKDVTVRLCQFIPSYNPDGSVFNYAPNPIGNHGFTGGKYYEGIVFELNLVLDGWSQSGSGSTDWYAWIHFYGLKDSKFINNRILATRGQNAIPFGFYTTSNGRYDPSTLISGTGIPLPHFNLEIRGNVIRGFNHADTDGGIIRAYGVNYEGVDYKIGNIIIEGNQFDDNSVGMTDDKNVGRTLIHVNLFNNVRIINNKSDNSRTFISAYDGQYLTIADNHVSRSAMAGMTLTSVFQVEIHHNIFENCRQNLNLLECYDVICKDNIFTNIQQMLVDGTFDYALRIRSTNNLQFSNNIIRTFAAGFEHGVYLYQSAPNTAKNLFVFDNIWEGFKTSNVHTTGTLTNYLTRNN
jgi:hypothetical protein